jgi:hypothetical protein
MHSTKLPIIILEDDLDDQEIIREVPEDLKVPYRIDFYTRTKDVLDYLYTINEKRLSYFPMNT